MNKLICEIKSALILNPAKRAAFREKHADDLHPERRQRNLLYEALSTAAMHARTFLPFKGIHTGQNICLVASGPTAKDYQPLTDTIHIAVNASFRMQSIPFDYIFVHDIHNRPTILKEMAKYRPDKCKKFFGIAREHTFNTDSTCPESDSIAAQALRYRKGADSYELPLDISTGNVCLNIRIPLTYEVPFPLTNQGTRQSVLPERVLKLPQLSHQVNSFELQAT